MSAPDLPAGIMPDYRREIPAELLARQGSWVWHEMVQPGVLRHLAADGSELLTVRILLPPNGLLSASTLRDLARWIREYALTGRRTSRQGFEFVGVRPEKLEKFLAELQAAGFPAGGTGKSLHQIKCCTSFIHCQNAAVDAPSIAQAITDYFYRDFLQQELPAPLKISIGGCPNQCGGGVEADIGILGLYESVPEVDEARFLAANIDIGLLVSWCPTGAIRPRQTEKGTMVTIDVDRCVRCTSCVQVAPEGISLKKKSYVAIAVGGHGGNSCKGPEMAAIVFPRVPARPLDYSAIIDRIEVIINYWSRAGKPGERLAGFIERTGWSVFLETIGAGPVEELVDKRPPQTNIRHDLHFRY
ncbi:Nitrite/sulphite reductase 4Fe-4S domain [Moorella glycerini]|uniref:Sulfite reductase, dissimilatory-type subunit beta n=1 Tax=Neomoorella stamsii TaxID=1266720 RepID=A0A9X7J4T4_9FIRM|nr:MULTISPECIES: hypothetical protein [Moorella]PRR75333.1 Sulfite reductase, dissimilatory-type subunit beta [Moorella stamsii]CEP67302.1 Nitrite/sulphite reductase 4Fe-4S domain [Moorella glycerini]